MASNVTTELNAKALRILWLDDNTDDSDFITSCLNVAGAFRTGKNASEEDIAQVQFWNEKLCAFPPGINPYLPSSIYYYL